MTPEAIKKQKADESLIKKVICKKEVKVQTEIVLEEKAVYLKKENPKIRYLKIQPHYRPQQQGKPYKIVPELTLCGNWLAEAGFPSNSYVSVTVMDGVLVIKTAQTETGND